MECEGKGCCWSPKDVSMIQCTVVCEQDIVGECFIMYTISPATHMLQGEPWCFHRSEVGFCTSDTGCGKYNIIGLYIGLFYP